MSREDSEPLTEPPYCKKCGLVYRLCYCPEKLKKKGQRTLI